MEKFIFNIVQNDLSGAASRFETIGYLIFNEISLFLTKSDTKIIFQLFSDLQCKTC